MMMFVSLCVEDDTVCMWMHRKWYFVCMWGYFFIILMSYGKIDNSGDCNCCSLSIVTQKIKSQRHGHCLKWTLIDHNLLRSISIFILVSYGIDKNCENNILKEQVRYYRNGVLFFKCLVLNKDLLSIRFFYKIFRSGAKAKF